MVKEKKKPFVQSQWNFESATSTFFHEATDLSRETVNFVRGRTSFFFLLLLFEIPVPMMRRILSTLLLPVFLANANFVLEEPYPELTLDQLYYQEPSYNRYGRHVGNYYQWYQQQQQQQQQQQIFLNQATSQAEWICRSPKTGDMMIITSEDVQPGQTPWNQQSHFPYYPNQQQPQYPHNPHQHQPPHFPHQHPHQYPNQQPPQYPSQQPPQYPHQYPNQQPPHNPNQQQQQQPPQNPQQQQPPQQPSKLPWLNQNNGPRPIPENKPISEQTTPTINVVQTTESTLPHGGIGLIDVRMGGDDD